MLSLFHSQLQDAFPRWAVPEVIPQGKYAILISELRETPDAPLTGYLWQITDRSLLMDFAAGTTTESYGVALDIASRVLSTIAKSEARTAYQLGRK